MALCQHQHQHPYLWTQLPYHHCHLLPNNYFSIAIMLLDFLTVNFSYKKRNFIICYFVIYQCLMLDDNYNYAVKLQKQNQFHIQRIKNRKQNMNKISQKHIRINHVEIENDWDLQILPLQSKVLKLQEELQELKKMKLKNSYSKINRNNSSDKKRQIQIQEQQQRKKIEKQKELQVRRQKQRQIQRERQKRIIQQELQRELNVKNAKVKNLIVEIKSNDVRSKSKYSKSQLKQKSNNKFDQISQKKNVSELCKNLQTAAKQNPRKKKLRINLTQLKDQNNQVQSNIFNVAIAQIMNTQEQRKLTMIEQIKDLKSKLEKLKQQSQSKRQSQSNYQAFDLKSSIRNWPMPTTALNRSMKGKLYRKSQIKSHQKSIQAKMDNNPIIKNVQLKKNANKLAWNPQMNLKINLNQKSQNFIRSGEQPSGRIYNISSFRGKSAVPTTSRTSMDLIKPFQKNFKRRPQSNDKYATISESNHKKYDSSYQNQMNQVQIINRASIPQQKYLNLNQPPTEFLQDFRAYINKKILMPVLPQIPTPYDQHSDLQTLGKVVFALFDVFVDEQVQNNPKNCQYKLIKYKNCVLFQLSPQKNIVWYYDNKFYFGGWDINIYGQGRKQGFGLDYVPNQYIYRGYFSNSKRKGYGIMINHHKSEQSKNVIYEGEWNQGIKEGMGYQIDQQSEYIGSFKEGIRDGCGKVKTKTSLYQGDIVKNIKQGKGYQKLINGDEYYGQFKSNRFHGKGQYKWKNSAYYNGTFKDGLRHGTGVWISNLNKQNFDTYKGAYEENKKNGYGVYKWANGAIYQGYFKNDLRHDEGLMKYPNGKAAKFMWKDGNIAKKIYSKQEEEYRKNRTKKGDQNQNQQGQFDFEQASNSQHHLTFMSGMKINLQNAVYSQFDRQSSYFFNTAKEKFPEFQSQRL